MIQINDNLLQEIGLGGLPPADKRSLLNHIYETLELRVGMRLADQMSNEQLDEFEKYFEAKDDKGAFTWLESNFPNYKDIVQQEFDKLKAEVAQSAPNILSAASSQAAVPQAPIQEPQQAQAQPYQSPSQPLAPPAPVSMPMQPQMPSYDMPSTPPPATPQPYQNVPQMPQQPPYTQPPAGPGL